MEIKTRLSEEEKDCLSVLYEKASPLLRKIVNRYCYSEVIREDVYQQVSLLALDVLQKYDPNRGLSLEKYLYTFLKGRVKDLSKEYLIKDSMDEVVLTLCPSRLDGLGEYTIDELLCDGLESDDILLLKSYYEEGLGIEFIPLDLNTNQKYARIQYLLTRLRGANKGIGGRKRTYASKKEEI